MPSPANHILIDANIARSATDPARHPTSRACFALASLLASKDCPTGAAMTPLLRAEWRKHASSTMVSWLASMESRRRIRNEHDKPVRDLRRELAGVEKGKRAAIEKDLHLSEAAILHGIPVASQDEKQKHFLAEIGTRYTPASCVQWLNPVTDTEWERWIVGGCVEREFYCPGSA